MKPSALKLRLPAKINLCLKVGPRRPDGFHDIDTLMLTVSLFDILTVRSARELHLVCEPTSLSSGPDNLVWKAAELLQKTCGYRYGAYMHLRKEIPWGAGLGGGSSDAAGALLGLNRLWGLNLPKSELRSLAARLGSDVPFFLEGGLARCTGRGEKVNVLPADPVKNLWFVIWNPGIILPTPAVYRSLDELRTLEKIRAYANLTDIESDVNIIVRDIFRGKPERWRGESSNDLEPAALHICEGLRRWFEVLSPELREKLHMSGSGSSLFAAADSRKEAENIRGIAMKLFPNAPGRIVAPYVSTWSEIN